ncbi:hypothetical protein RRG08_000316 [Elysia crispata]|uniref:Uncharacterized protein n=1 Tax=Elysia crispata TaxID=231223 RepID=A0AAE1BBR1_9GAST|nr:hypothetical protein RRG08_000316 [Elysia crispata]
MDVSRQSIQTEKKIINANFVVHNNATLIGYRSEPIQQQETIMLEARSYPGEASLTTAKELHQFMGMIQYMSRFSLTGFLHRPSEKRAAQGRSLAKD